jgi:hypothetical protein
MILLHQNKRRRESGGKKVTSELCCTVKPELKYIRVHIPVLVGQKKKIDCFCFEVSLFRFPGYFILGRFYYTNLLQTCVFSVLLGSSHAVR